MSLTGPSLVTGALGQDGFLLCQRLRAKGVEVVGIVRQGGNAARRRLLERDLGCRLVEMELAEPKPLTTLVTNLKPTSIFHMAAAHHSSEGTESPDAWRAMIAINLLTTETIARAVTSLNLDCSLVYASSSQIWTARDMEHRVDETTPVEPSTFYGHTKVCAANLLAQYRKHLKLKASAAFLFNHESPWRRPDFVSRKIAMAAARAARGDTTPLQLINIGARADWQAATDVVDALILMAEAETPDDYVLASGRSRSVRDFVAAAYDHVGLDWREWVIADRDQAGPVLIGVADKARRQLGWRPCLEFNHLVHEMVDADLARLMGEMTT